MPVSRRVGGQAVWQQPGGQSSHGQSGVDGSCRQGGHLLSQGRQGVGRVDGAPPGHGRGGRLRAGRVGLALQEPGQVGLQGPEARQLGPDLGEPLAEQGLGVAAGALALVGDLEQLADLAQPQPGPLGALDQAQPADRRLVVEPVAGRRAGRLGQEPDAFVVADGVGAEPGLAGEGGDGECHERRVDPGPRSKVKPRAVRVVATRTASGWRRGARRWRPRRRCGG